MKLFVALLLTLSAQNQAPAHAAEEEDLPNLRGVVGIALTKKSSKKRDESYGTSSSSGTTCKQEGHPCNPDNSGCCSALNCIATGDQVGPSYKCASSLDTSSAAAGDEKDGIALTNGEDYGPPIIRMAACRKVDQWCSTTSTNHRYQCCDVDELGTTQTQSLTCQESATVISNPFYNGICVASSSEIEV